MEFKNYERQYEYVFTSEQRKKKIDSCFKAACVYEDYPVKTLNELAVLFNKELDGYFGDIFDRSLKLIWLLNRIRSYKKNAANSMSGVRIRPFFCERYANIDMRTFSKNPLYCLCQLIIKDYFPDFYKIGPYDHEYKFPFKYMSFTCIELVRLLPFRKELLEYGEKKKMNYPEFVDYVINHIKCLGDEGGDYTYELCFSTLYGGKYIRSYAVKTRDVPRRQIF